MDQFPVQLQEWQPENNVLCKENKHKLGLKYSIRIISGFHHHGKIEFRVNTFDYGSGKFLKTIPLQSTVQ